MSRRAFLPVLALAALGGCALFEPMPVAVTGASPPGEVTDPPPPRSAASRALSDYYARVEDDLLSQGLLRRDGGTASAPFGARELVQDFIRIALYDEYTISGDRLIARPQPSTLRRWTAPVRMSVEFGASVPADQRRRDLQSIRSYAARLSRVSGHPVTVGGSNPNFHVLVLNEDERLRYGPRLQSLVPGLGPAARRALTDMDRTTFCLVHAYSSAGEASAFSSAVAVIRGEHPDLLRLSCIHEELAQGMGLANDSPRARPSIFNDDEEFALLTPHDELLLKMLYDRRLRVGMREAEATPILREIADEFFAGAS